MRQKSASFIILLIVLFSCNSDSSHKSSEESFINKNGINENQRPEAQTKIGRQETIDSSTSCVNTKSQSIKDNNTTVELELLPIQFPHKDYLDSTVLDTITIAPDNTIDLNFDGNKDLKIFNQEYSGTGGEYYDVFIFEPTTLSYVYSENLSGNLAEVDSVHRTLSYYWKAGVSLNQLKILHLSDSGNTDLIEKITREIVGQPSGNMKVTTYQKYRKNQLIETQVDTTEFEGY